MSSKMATALASASGVSFVTSSTGSEPSAETPILPRPACCLLACHQWSKRPRVRAIVAESTGVSKATPIAVMESTVDGPPAVTRWYQPFGLRSEEESLWLQDYTA